MCIGDLKDDLVRPVAFTLDRLEGDAARPGDISRRSKGLLRTRLHVFYKLQAGILDLVGIKGEDVERVGDGQERNFRAEGARETHAVLHGPLRKLRPICCDQDMTVHLSSPNL